MILDSVLKQFSCTLVYAKTVVSFASKSDEWRNFNNFGRSMFAGWVVSVSLCCCCCIFLLKVLIANLFVIFSKHLLWSFLFPLFCCCRSIVDSYLPDLVLQGVQDNNFRGSLSTDLKFTLQVSDVNNQCTANQLMFISQCIYSLLRNFTDTIVDHVISLSSIYCLIFVFLVITSLELILIWGVYSNANDIISF